MSSAAVPALHPSGKFKHSMTNTVIVWASRISDLYYNFPYESMTYVWQKLFGTTCAPLISTAYTGTGVSKLERSHHG